MLQSEIPSSMCTKLHTVAASNNRVHMHIPFVVNHTFNATPLEWLQQPIQYLCRWQKILMMTHQVKTT